jgi:hypothetical protein
MEKFGLTDTDDDGELSADFIERFGHLMVQSQAQR